MSVRTSPDSYREKTKNKGQEEHFSAFIFWYLGPESNRHTRKYRILNPARLPVPPPRHLYFAVRLTAHLPMQAGAKIRNYFKSTSASEKFRII